MGKTVKTPVFGCWSNSKAQLDQMEMFMRQLHTNLLGYWQQAWYNIQRFILDCKALSLLRAMLLEPNCGTTASKSTNIIIQDGAAW